VQVDFIFSIFWDVVNLYDLDVVKLKWSCWCKHQMVIYF